MKNQGWKYLNPNNNTILFKKQGSTSQISRPNIIIINLLVYRSICIEWYFSVHAERFFSKNNKLSSLADKIFLVRPLTTWKRCTIFLAWVEEAKVKQREYETLKEVINTNRVSKLGMYMFKQKKRLNNLEMNDKIFRNKKKEVGM